MGSRTAGRAASIAAALLLSVGCTPGSPPSPSPHTDTAPPTQPLSGLTPLELPDRLQPSTLEPAAGELIIGGYRGSTAATRRPGMAVIGSGGARSIGLTPSSPYAAVADIFSVAPDGTRLEALGSAHGGAHANPRWTTWSGSTSRVVEHPQVFSTFGGEEAGVLTAIVTTPAGPRIVGSWQGTTALDIALWRPDGAIWSRLDSAGTPLANTPTLQVSGRSAAATPAGMIIAGSVLDLAGGIRQGAAVWLSAGDRQWTLARLPDPGRRSEAGSVTCPTMVCWVAGQVDGRLALWTVDSGSGSAIRLGDLPLTAIGVDGPLPRLVAGAAEPTVAYSVAGRTSVVSRSASGWVTRSGPAGDLIAAAKLGDRLYLATSTAPGKNVLWSAVG